MYPGNDMRSLHPTIRFILELNAAASVGCGSGVSRQQSLYAPPDNIQVGNGVWGVDIDEDLSVVLSGTRSIRFNSTLPFDDPYIENIDPVEVVGGQTYTGEVIWRADSAASPNTVRAEVRWLDGALADVSQSTIYSGLVDSANAWEVRRASVTAPVSARWARVRVYKNNLAFQAWVDGFDMFSAVPFLAVTRASTNQSISSGTPTTVVFNSIATQRGVTYDPGTGIVTADVAGIYVLNGYIRMASIPNGSGVWVRADVNGSPTQIADVRYNWSGAAMDMAFSFMGFGEADVGDELEIVVEHDSGSARDLQIGTTLVGARIE